MHIYELNLDGLVGPNHNYAGLSTGNLASTSNALHSSNPQAAALQGIAKMRLMHRLGIQQAFLPPHPRPNLELLHLLGFSGTATEQIAKVSQRAPELLPICYSASSMWTANAATVTSSLDSLDQRIQFSAANLCSNLHRSQEADFNKGLLEYFFNDPRFFAHHPIMPPSNTTSDEGAANHSRLCAAHNMPGLNFFVYGREALQKKHQESKFPARQTLEACQAIARAHQLDPHKVIFAQQNPRAIDAGVFHNDVISVANEALLLVHEEAFLEQEKVLNILKSKADFPLQIVEVKNARISLELAVSTYLFNSQLISLPRENGQTSMALIAPIECQHQQKVRSLIDEWLSDSSSPIHQVHYLDLKQSMQNGGGPACLRLRVPLTANELEAMHQGIRVNDSLLDRLEDWVKSHYRTQLSPLDLADPHLVDECFTALDALCKLLKLKSLYPFQRG